MLSKMVIVEEQNSQRGESSDQTLKMLSPQKHTVLEEAEIEMIVGVTDFFGGACVVNCRQNPFFFNPIFDRCPEAGIR